MKGKSCWLLALLILCWSFPAFSQTSTSTFPCRTSTNTSSTNERSGCIDPIIKWSYTNPSGVGNTKYFDSPQEAAQARLAEYKMNNPNTYYEAVQEGPIEYETYYWCSKPDDHVDNTYTTYKLNSSLYFYAYFYGWQDNGACSGSKDVYYESSGTGIGVTALCPYAYTLYRSEENHTKAPYGYVCIPKSQWREPASNCASPTHNPEGSCTTPNPVHLVTRAKQEIVTDLKTSGPWPIEWTRTYISNSTLMWQFNQEKRLFVSISPTTGLARALFKSALGVQFEFKTTTPPNPTGDGVVWVPSNSTSAENNMFSSKLTHALENGTLTYTLTHRDGTKDVFRNTYLIRRENQEGYKHFYEYNAATKRLYKISDEFGHAITIHNLPNNGATPTTVYYSTFMYDSSGVRTRSTSSTTFDRYANATSSLVEQWYLPLSVTNGTQTVTYEWGPAITSSSPYLSHLNKVTYSDGKITEYRYKETIKGVANGTMMLTGIIDGVTGERLHTYFYNGSTSDTVKEEWKGGDVNGVGAKETYILDYTTATDQNGNAFSFTTDATLRKIKTLSASCYFCLEGLGLSKKAYTYDAFGNVISSTDFSGMVEHRTYDSQQRVLTQKLNVGTSEERLVTYTYTGDHTQPDTMDEQVWVNGVLNNVLTTYTYNTRRQLTQEVKSWNQEQRVWMYNYNAQSLLESVISDFGQTAFVYNTQGWVTSVVQGVGTPLERATVYSNFTSDGLPQTITTPDGTSVHKTYDAAGRVLSLTEHGQTQTYTYNSQGLLSSVTQPDGSSQTYVYGTGQALMEVHQLSSMGTLVNKMVYTRDGMNNITSVTIERNGVVDRTQAYTWSKFKSIATSTDAFNQQTTYGYHSVKGLLLTMQEPLGRNQSFAYDTLGRLSSHTQPNGGVNQLTYDGSERIRQAQDSRQVSTTYTYNGFGEVTGVQSPDRGTWNLVYDRGRLLTMSDPRGVVRRFYYDALNRVASVVYDASALDPAQTSYMENGSETHTFVYDSCHMDRLCSVTDAQGQSVWTYDSWGRLSGTTRHDGSLPSLSLSQTYDTRGRPSTMTYPSGKVVSWTYGSDGLISSISYDNTPVLLSTWNALAQPLVLDYGLGVTQTMVYDLNGQVSSVSYPSQSVSYVRDELQRITWLQSLVNQSYVYNTQNEVTSTEVSSWSVPQAYTYDLNGNRLTSLQDASGTQFEYATNSNRLLSFAPVQDGVLGLPVNVDYDAMGNIVSTQIDTITYDAKGRLGRWVANGVQTRMYYNAQGQRTKKIVTGGSAPGVFLEHYDPQGRLMGVYQPNANGGVDVVEELLYLDHYRVVASVRPDATLGMASAQVYPVLTDHLGTPRQILDDTGTLLWSWEQTEAYGHQAPNEHHTSERFVYDGRFPGQRFDTSTSSLHNGFRTYSTKLGRYMQSDPLGLDAGWNTYAYVEGNPVSSDDPLGLKGGVSGRGGNSAQRRREERDHMRNAQRPFNQSDYVRPYMEEEDDYSPQVPRMDESFFDSVCIMTENAGVDICGSGRKIKIRSECSGDGKYHCRLKNASGNQCYKDRRESHPGPFLVPQGYDFSKDKNCFCVSESGKIVPTIQIPY